MKILTAIMVVLIGLAMPHPEHATKGSAQGQLPFPSDAKLASIDVQEVVSQSRLGKAGQEQVKALLSRGGSAAQQDALNVKLAREFDEKLMPVVESIRAERGLWMVLPMDTLAAVDPRLNLSSDVARRLDVTSATPKSRATGQVSQSFPIDARVGWIDWRTVLKGTKSDETTVKQLQVIVDTLRQEHGLWAILGMPAARMFAVEGALDLSSDAVKRLGSGTVPPARRGELRVGSGARVGWLDFQVVVQGSRLGKLGSEQMKVLENNGASVTERDALNAKLLSEFLSKALPIVEAIRAERLLWLVLTPNSGFVSVEPALELSSELIRRLDASAENFTYELGLRAQELDVRARWLMPSTSASQRRY